MAYSRSRIFIAIDQLLSTHPYLTLPEIAKFIKCSHPTIQKAIFAETGLRFREHRKIKMFYKILVSIEEGLSAKEIASAVGYKWPEHLARFVKSSTGRSLRELRGQPHV